MAKKRNPFDPTTDKARAAAAAAREQMQADAAALQRKAEKPSDIDSESLLSVDVESLDIVAPAAKVS